MNCYERGNWWKCAVAALGMSVCAGGCVTEGPAPRDPPTPIPAQPEGLRPTLMSFSVGRYDHDEDGNGYLDSFDATVYLFTESYPYSLSIPGSLSFTLSDKRGQVLARWTYSEAKAATLLKPQPPGMGYLVRLSLLEVGSDTFEPQMAELSCEFVPSNGTPVRSKGGRAVRIGRVK